MLRTQKRLNLLSPAIESPISANALHAQPRLKPGLLLFRM
jgi:hypothetical protein